MTVRPVLRLGDPRLRQVAEPVQDFAPMELSGLIGDLRRTMAALDVAWLAVLGSAPPCCYSSRRRRALPQRCGDKGGCAPHLP
jgi:hypothetical protein